MERFQICVLRVTGLGYLPIKIFLGQHNHPVYEVPEDGDQFVVVAGLEILPGKIVVLGLRGIGSEHVPEHILHVREVL